MGIISLDGGVFMGIFEKEIDITKNIRIIERLKSEMLAEIANLFRTLVNGVTYEVHDVLADTLSNIILISYLLGRRLGISYNAIEMKMRNKIRLGLVESIDNDRGGSDLMELSKHLDSSRSRKDD